MLVRVINITIIGLSLIGVGCASNQNRPTGIDSEPLQTVQLDCVPYQRDLTRAWNSKRGYCIGDDRVSYRPVGQSSRSIGNPNDKGSILNQGDWEEIPVTPRVIEPNAKPIVQPGESVNKDSVSVIVAATADKPPIHIEQSVTSTERVLQFDRGSSQLSKYEKQRVKEIVNALREHGEPAVVWLQASLASDEMLDRRSDSDRLGVNRSIAVKNELSNMGFKDVRIMFPLQDSNESVVNVLLKGEA